MDSITRTSSPAGPCSSIGWNTTAKPRTMQLSACTGFSIATSSEVTNRIRGYKSPMDASERMDQLIAEIPDWRGKTFAAVRKDILAADVKIIEEWKWMGSPVWSRDGIIAV